MKKQIKITVPTDFSAISLRKYIDIQKDLDAHKDDETAMNAFLLYNFCGITPTEAVQIDTETLNNIVQDIINLTNKTDYPLQRKITLDGVEYGFEPNLSAMPYGAYLDISSFDSLTLDANWAKVVSILYRPITNKKGALYEIEPYKGYTKKDAEKWMDVTMDFHFSVFFYFLGLYKDLLNATLNSMKNLTAISPNIKRILAKSGELTHQLSNLQRKIF